MTQTVPVEVIVVDDGSEDDSGEVIASYNERIVPVLRHWSGQAAAINAGIAAAAGSIVFLLDSDDLADPHRVETIAPLFEQDRSLLWVRHSLRAVDDEDRVVVDSLYSFRGGHAAILQQVLREGRTAGSTSGLVLRRRFFDEFGPIPERYTTYPDSYLLIRGALTGHGASVRETLGAHRWHRGSFTAYDWRQVNRAPFHLSLRKSLAEDAADLARRVGGPSSIAEGGTWWQLKAFAEWQKSGLESQAPWLTSLTRFLRALASSGLPMRSVVLLALRDLLLFSLPRPVFLRAWWLTHVGRPSLLKTSVRDRLT